MRRFPRAVSISVVVGAYCYDNFGGDMVEVQSIFSDALLNFNMTETFDGSGELFG